MTDWREDLWNLLTEVDPNPVEDITGSAVGQGVVGALGSDQADYIFKTLDAPASVARGTLGSAVNLIQGEGLHGIEQGQQQWDEAIGGFREADLGPFGILKTPLEIGANLLVDPLTYTGFGLAGKGARGLRGAANEAALASRTGVSNTLRAAAYPLQTAQTLNDLPGNVLLPPVQAGVRQVGRGVTRLWPEALTPSETSLRRTRTDTLDNIANDLSSGRVDPNRPMVPTVEPITRATAPPVMPTPHPATSAPATIQSAARESWRRLREGLFDPRVGIIPGGPGRSERIDPIWTRPEDVTLTERNLEDMATIGAQVMQTITDSGGIMPGVIRASQGMNRVQKEIVEKYGAGIQPYLPAIHGRIREKLGPNADAIMPSSRFLLPNGWANGIVKSRRLSSLNARVTSGELTRKEALEELRQAGTQRGSPEDIEGAASMGAAFLSLMPDGGDDVFRKFRAGDPESVWFPDEEPLTGAVGLVPTGFRDALWEEKLGEGPLRMSQAQGTEALEALGIGSAFGDTREAWRQYMRGTFGELRDDELEVLEEMTTDILYQAYVNAANEVSGNSIGAGSLARNVVRDAEGRPVSIDPAATRAPDREPVLNADGTPKRDKRGRIKTKSVPETGGPLYGAEHAKIGAYATEPGDIGGEKAQEVLRSLDDPERRDTVAEWYGSFSKSKQHKAVSGTAGKVPGVLLWGEQLRLARGLEKLPTAEDVSEILGKTRKLNANSIKDALRSIGEEPLSLTNTGTGGMLPNLTQLQRIITEGHKLPLSSITREAKDWYRESAREIEAIVGTGNYEDATFLLDVIGITSASTEVSENADLALRVLAEWKMGRDDTLRARFKINAAQFEEIRKGNLLNADMMPSHRNRIAAAINEYALRRENPQRMPVSVQMDPGGWAPKTWDYASSFMVNIWRDQIGKALESSPMLQEIRQALDDAVSLFTVDRHMSRLESGPTDVAQIEYFLLRERGNIAAKTLKLSPEEAQAAGWYWVRDRQGFLREIRGDSDLAYALRSKIEEAWGSSPPTAGEPGQQTRKTWDELKTMVKEAGNVADGDETTAIYNLVRQEIFYRLLKRSFDKPQVQQALREAGLPDTLSEMQRDILAVVQRQAFAGADQDIPMAYQDAEGAAPAFNAPEDLAYKRQREEQLLAAKLAETDVTNSDSLYARKIKQPVMEIYAENSIKRTVKETTGTDIADLNLPEWPDNATGYGSLGYDPKLNLQQNEFLETKLSDGTSYRTYVKKEAAEADQAIRALREANITWGAYASPAERLEAVGDNPKLREIVEEWNKRGVDLLTARDGNQVAVHLLDELIDKEEGVKHARPTHYDMLKAIWTEHVLFSPKYHTGNLLGGWTQNALAGVFTNPLTTTRDVWKAFKAIRAGSDQVSKQEALASLKGTEIAQYYGSSEMPAEVFRGGIRAVNMGDADFGPSAIGTAVGRLTRNESLGRKVGWAFAASNDLALGIDTGVRAPVWGQSLKDAMEEMLPAWEGEVRRRGEKIPGFAFDRANGVNAPPSFQSDVLKKHLMGLGFQSGEADHLVRQYVEIHGMGLKKAKAELGRVQFYLERTKLDEKIGKFVPFHYYPSRALRYYGEEAIRNPYLVLNYMRLADGMEDALNDPGLSARQKGFIRLLGTPLGFSLLMNPDALFGVVKVFGMQETYETDGETSLGGALNWLKLRGIGLYPWIDGTINLMGMYGNTFEPDLLGIRHKALVGGAVQFVRAHLGFDPAGAPYAAAMGHARYAVSSFVSGVMPWLSEPVTPRAGGSSQEASLDSLIESVVIENLKATNPTVTNQQLLDIMSDPDSPEYESAYRTVADAGLVTQLLNFTAPVRFTMRQDARDVRMAQMDAVQEEADRLGVPPWEVAPTPDDLQFHARYEALTGKEYQPGDYETAKFKHDLARAPLEAKDLLVAEAEYNVIGTTKQRRHYEAYMAFLDGTDPRTVNLSEVGRRELANQYLDRTRGAAKAVEELQEIRREYVAAHPEFAEFKDWQGRMYDLKEQLGGSLTEYRRQASQQNPNAARYFADQLAYLNRTVPDEEERARRFDDVTANANAFQAITGKAQARSVPGPFPGVPPADITLPNMLPAVQSNGFAGNAMSRELARIGANAGIRNLV